MCSDLVENGSVESPINFFTQHNRDSIIFRADPDWNDSKNPWYDWAQVKWDGFEHEVPAQLQVFMDLRQNFNTTFQVGQSYVTEAGCYAVARTFQDMADEKAHGQSKLVYYGELVYEQDTNTPQMCMFNVDSITKPMVAVPYVAEKDVYNAREWLILKPKSLWYETLINLLDIEVHKKSTTIKF